MSHEADVVIVGYGCAGASAALRAAELGATAIVLEKQPQGRHTPSTKMSGGHIMVISDADAGTRYLDRAAGGMIPIELSRAWAERATSIVEWLDAQGTNLRLRRAYGAEHPEFEGSEEVHVYMQGRRRDGTEIEFTRPDGYDGDDSTVMGLEWGRTGFEFFNALAEAVDARDSVEVMWESPGHRLVTEDGRVVGVEVKRGDETIVVRARAGVVLTCGGYEYDEEIKLNYLKAPGIHFYGNPGNTGDGIRMAQDVGAELWHMNQMGGRAIARFALDDGTVINFPNVMYQGIWLDALGRRFTNEHKQMLAHHDVYDSLLEYSPELGSYTRIPTYWVFDERVLERPMVMDFIGPVVVGMYDWSPDNQVEVDRGWIVKGDSVEEVVAKAGMPQPSDAAATVAEYNRACAEGVDPLGRPAESLVPIEGPPYFCVPLVPGGPNTSGGPKRNARAEILNPYGETIPGLYGAGELGQPVGQLYPSGGCNLSEAICFGQIAVESALGRSAPTNGAPEVGAAAAR